MLENLYQSFGILGSLFISLAIFILLIFWVAGIAGLTDSSQRNIKKWQIILSVIFPPFPVGWLIFDMIRQYKQMNQN